MCRPYWLSLALLAAAPFAQACSGEGATPADPTTSDSAGGTGGAPLASGGSGTATSGSGGVPTGSGGVGDPTGGTAGGGGVGAAGVSSGGATDGGSNNGGAMNGGEASGGSAGDPDPPGGRTHLLLFSGQSNMSRMLWSDFDNYTGLQLDKVFMPAVQAAFPDDHFVVVPVAYGGRPISNWVPRAAIYDELVAEAKQKMAGKTPSTITFLWRQGEADHDSNALAQAYKSNLSKLYAQLTDDFETTEINWVIGRLNDASNRMDPDYRYHDNWMLIRQDEVDTANGMERARWVDCDMFNDGAGNGVHGSASDYLAQQQAFADSTIELLEAFP